MDGLRFLVSMYRANVGVPALGRQVCGVCLADDMGLGKTLQTIAFLQHVADLSAAPRGTGVNLTTGTT